MFFVNTAVHLTGLLDAEWPWAALDHSVMTSLFCVESLHKSRERSAPLFIEHLLSWELMKPSRKSCQSSPGELIEEKETGKELQIGKKQKDICSGSFFDPPHLAQPKIFFLLLRINFIKKTKLYKIRRLYNSTL